jgi:hypothetical protein
MGVPLDLGGIFSGFLSADAYSANNQLIEDAVGKALDRTGSTANNMEVPLDMGLHNIFNLKSAILSHQAVPLQQVLDILSASGENISSLVIMEDRFTALGGETVRPIENFTYTPTTNSLMVFKDGVYQRAGFEYEETSDSEITFTTPLATSNVIDIFGQRYDAQQYVNLAIQAAAAAAVSVTDSAQSATDAAASATAAADAAGYLLEINNQVGTTYTLLAADEGDFVRMDNAAANTLIVPPDSEVNFDLGTIILVRQVGVGTTTIQQGLGVTVNSPFNAYDISQADFGIALVKIAANTWDMVKSFGGVETSDLVAFTQEFDARLQEFYTELLSADPTFVVNFDALQQQVTNSIATIENEFAVLETSVADTVGTVTADFAVIDADFGILNIQFTALQDDFDIIQPAFITIQNDFAALTTRFDTIESDFAGFDARIDTVQASLDALNIGGASFESALFTNGYQNLPSGLIMQWGGKSVYGHSAARETYPIPFPNATLNVTATIATASVLESYRTDVGCAVGSWDTTGFTLVNYVSPKYTGNTLINWFAIGY